ncbi:MAG TPA: signal peptidase I [Spirochaetota bacterium]|nr:signal peptidase I [Spirochaetota bacterium]HRZ28357.1 signal peptidase I [Spirochaetota bacterium]HSA14722.1 signal peptidase I [Spirochaetota bacterium]
MIQFLRVDKEKINPAEFSVIAGREAAVFFLKRLLYLILFIYSTQFLAVALPFVKTPFTPVYFIGSLATFILLARVANHIIKYVKFSGGKISVAPAEIIVHDSKNGYRISTESITYLEHNILGNLVIKEKYDRISFPLMLLAEDDREKLLAAFQDMAPKRTKNYRKIWEFVDAVVVALVLAVHIIQYIVQAYYIPTGSMEDTLQIGDHLFVEKITYGPIIPQMFGMEKSLHLSCLGIRGVERGDIVIFRPPHEQDKDYIKRCIALPGDRFEIKEGSVWINNKKLEEPYTKGITRWYNFGGEKNEIDGVVPQGKVVVLGDNRENSQDGRYFGYLEIEKIKGRAFILYWNTSQVLNFDFSRFGLIR